MNLDDLIVEFEKLEKADTEARFGWNAIGDTHTIFLAGASSTQVDALLRTLMNEAGRHVPESVDNPGKNSTERFIVEVFRRVPELIDTSSNPVLSAEIGNVGEKRQRPAPQNLIHVL